MLSTKYKPQVQETSTLSIPAFRTLVWKHYKEYGRQSLPWRKTHDPYRILVSEIMLQQTQVERVIDFYNAWMKKYPTIAILAAAPLSEVLISWQGLGYNRRAKMLHEAAKKVVQEYKGKLPKTFEELQALPGIGPYTARAVAAFAHNADVVFIETNLRTVVSQHFFRDQSGILDADILAILAKALPKGQAREWYAALMDYGTHLKRSGVRINAKSKTYAKQSAFEGSGRQVRGAILRELSSGSKIKKILEKLFPKERRIQIDTQLERLIQEGFVQKKGIRYSLAD